MTLKDSGKLKVFVCDGAACGLEWGKRFHPAEIGSHARMLPNDGWRAVRIAGVFRHFCPRCEPPGGFDQYSKPRGKKARKAAAAKPEEPATRWRADIDG